MALDGKLPDALARFEAIATSLDAPEAMDILAGLYRAQGDAAASNRWAARAGSIWQSRLKLLPEAAWAHVAEHELAFGSPRTALGFAGKNARIRPDAAALLLLAKAWIANGRADYALALCRKIERSGWVSAEQWLVRADALSLLGRGDEMRAAQDRAKALNPRALERNPAFAWLDH
jgi:tetratricopeptide (TPR) repeat protein